MSRPVYIIDGCRSPIGRGHPEKGMYRNLRADDLTAQVLNALRERTALNPDQIDDFYLGCVGQHLEQGKNLARLVLLLAGMPHAIPGATVNRLCASSMTALQMAFDSIKSGTNSTLLVGGVEHLGHVPMSAAVDYNPKLFENYEFQWTNMGLTAEKLADKYSISREEQDQFTIDSTDKYIKALDDYFFVSEVIPITLTDTQEASVDEEPRRSTLEQLSALSPVFKENGTVTAANSSGISDGACVSLISCENNFEKKPLAEIKSFVNIGLDPTEMGLGPVLAINKLLEKTGMSKSDIDLYEINEAFAAQVIACQRELNLPPDKLNIHGGAVALGHPLGMSGLRIVITLAHSLKTKKLRYGIASLCVGHGQGVAVLIENINL